MIGVMSSITERFVDPVSVMIAPGFRYDMICLTTLAITPTGTAKKIMSASETVALMSSANIIGSPICFASAQTSAELSNPLISDATP